MLSQYQELLNRLFPLYAALPQVQAIGLGGSLRGIIPAYYGQIDCNEG